MRWLSCGMAVCGCFLAGTAAADMTPRVGEPHPDFVLPDIETGKPVSLSHFRGKKILLLQFASW